MVGVEAIVDLAVAVVVELVFAEFFGGEDLALAIGPFAVDAKLRADFADADVAGAFGTRVTIALLSCGASLIAFVVCKAVAIFVDAVVADLFGGDDLAFAGAKDTVDARLDAAFTGSDAFGANGSIVARAGVSCFACDGLALGVVFVGQAVAIVVDAVAAIGAIDGFRDWVVGRFAKDLGGNTAALHSETAWAEFPGYFAGFELSFEVFIDLTIAIVIETVAGLGNACGVFGFTA